MLQTITKREINKAAKEYVNQHGDKDWQDAVNIFKFMSDFLSKQKFVNNKIIFNENKHTIIHNGQELTLPKKEYFLALYLYNNSNKIISRDELLENIWLDVCVGERTVDVHVRKLRSQIPNIPIKTHIGIGYGWI